MTTFSQLVDDLVVELIRPDMKTTLSAYVNQTVREMHFRPSQNLSVLYDANRHEANEVVVSANPWLWDIPSVTRFIDIEACYCQDLNLYIDPRNPTVVHRETFEPFAKFYRYRTGTKIAVSGVEAGQTMKLSYFMYVQNLQYKILADRLVKYDADTDSYVYIADGLPASDEDLTKETHWMLQRWDSVIKEGVRAKAWKRLGDDTRTRMAFSAYESMRAGVWQSEPSS